MDAFLFNLLLGVWHLILMAFVFGSWCFILLGIGIKGW